MVLLEVLQNMNTEFVGPQINTVYCQVQMGRPGPVYEDNRSALALQKLRIPQKHFSVRIAEGAAIKSPANSRTFSSGHRNLKRSRSSLRWYSNVGNNKVAKQPCIYMLC